MKNFPAQLRYGVIPIESPTVPKAETVSKRLDTNTPRPVIFDGAPTRSNERTKNVMTITSPVESAMMMCACRTVLEGIVLLKADTASLPRKCDRISSMITAKVLVFTPPPVEAGEAPMNMRTMTIRMLGEHIGVDRVNPAVRG
jgi:hypothetical protein